MLNTFNGLGLKTREIDRIKEGFDAKERKSERKKERKNERKKERNLSP